VKCRLIVHGMTREFDMGEFPSVSKAKDFARGCIDKPYSIIKIKNYGRKN